MRLAMLRIQLTLQRTRILLAGGILLIALFALPIVTNQTQPPATSNPPTAQPQPTIPPPTATPSYRPGTIVLGMGEHSCALTPAGNQPSLTLGDGCDDVEERLRLPNSGTIWLSLTISDQPDLWLPLDIITDDPTPPQLDQRGRYFGCTQDGEQVCQVKVEIDTGAYQIAIPLTLDGAAGGA